MTDQTIPMAFPSVCMNDPGHPASIPGMLLRDWFAGQAASVAISLALKHSREASPAPMAAMLAYEFADAMLAARGDA